MRTAEEMYDYCKKNDYGQGVNKKWDIKHFTLIQDSLAPDEEVLMCFVGIHNYVSATKHDGNYAYAITNKRIIMAQKKVIGENIQSIAFNNLNDITLSAGLLMGVIVIDTVKEVFNVCVNIKQARKINEQIHNLLIDLQNRKTSPTQAQVSEADELLKFKNLLDAGAISEDEYNMKKKQILGI